MSEKLEEIKYNLKKFISNKSNLYKSVLIIVILIFAIFFRITDSLGQDKITIEEKDSSKSKSNVSEIFIDIGGEVNSPGVYKVKDGTRLFEVINMAGGLTNMADTYSVNQAEHVEDGAKIVIPKIDNTQGNDSENIDKQTNDVELKSSINKKVNINIASKEELMTLNGIGEAIAERILSYRKEHKFKKAEEIMSVPGIGNAKYEKIKDNIII